MDASRELKLRKNSRTSRGQVGSTIVNPKNSDVLSVGVSAPERKHCIKEKKCCMKEPVTR